jgi:flagellar basal-body rod protein FlgF
MASRGIYSALSGAMAQAQRLDTISNNIANATTPGFKKDEQVFREYLTANEKPPEVIQVPKVPGSLESFYDLQGADVSFVENNATYTDFTQGSLKHTGGALDVAIDGKGFFEVMTPAGMRLTRVGSFSIDGNGRLVNKDGFPIMMDAAPGVDPEERALLISGQAPLHISQAGEIYQGEDLLGKLSLVDVADKDNLQKVGQNLFGFKSNAQPEIIPVEMSNVNLVKEMTDLIQATRLFETSQKAIQAYDSINDKMVNVVPKT